MFYYYFKSCNASLHFPSILFRNIHILRICIFARFQLSNSNWERCRAAANIFRFFTKQSSTHSIDTINYLHAEYGIRLKIHWTQCDAWAGMYMGSFEYCLPSAIILLAHPHIGLRVTSTTMCVCVRAMNRLNRPAAWFWNWVRCLHIFNLKWKIMSNNEHQKYATQRI